MQASTQHWMLWNAEHNEHLFSTISLFRSLSLTHSLTRPPLPSSICIHCLVSSTVRFVFFFLFHFYSIQMNTLNVSLWFWCNSVQISMRCHILLFLLSLQHLISWWTWRTYSLTRRGTKKTPEWIKSFLSQPRTGQKIYLVWMGIWEIDKITENRANLVQQWRNSHFIFLKMLKNGKNDEKSATNIQSQQKIQKMWKLSKKVTKKMQKS